MKIWKPSKQEIAAAAGKRVADVIAPDLRIVFCGINPGLYSAATGHHFARPGNRFWPALFAAELTPRLYSPFEDTELPALGYGIINIVDRSSAAADELSPEELREGAKRLERKTRRYHPRAIAFLGVTAYRRAFDRPKAALGRQEEKMGNTAIWVLPNPSGLNANYQLKDLARLFRHLSNEVA